jgi:hypothetical protein
MASWLASRLLTQLPVSGISFTAARVRRFGFLSTKRSATAPSPSLVSTSLYFAIYMQYPATSDLPPYRRVHTAVLLHVCKKCEVEGAAGIRKRSVELVDTPEIFADATTSAQSLVKHS